MIKGVKQTNASITKLENIWRKIDFVFNWVIIILMSALVITTTIQVFYRYILNNPLTWTSELSRFLFIWITFLGAWYVFKKGGHLGLDIIVINLPRSIKSWTAKLVELIIVIFLLVVLWKSPEFLMMTKNQTSPALGLSMFYIYLSFPLSAFLMLGEILLGWISPTRVRVGEKNIEVNQI